MTPNTISDDLVQALDDLNSMLDTAKRLQQKHIPQLAGDIERIVAILADKVRHLDPEQFEHVADYQ
jgi:ABC-type transporter Mla subunit MlaD